MLAKPNMRLLHKSSISAACCWCVTTGPVAVQVVEVLRQLPQRDLLAEAISFNAMGPHEVATLGRVLR